MKKKSHSEDARTLKDFWVKLRLKIVLHVAKPQALGWTDIMDKGGGRSHQ